VRDRLEQRRPDDAFYRIQLCALGLRAQAELAALARADPDPDALREQLVQARKLLAAAVTPNAAGWRALVEAEYGRAQGRARPEECSKVAAMWDRLERPPLAAYCRWRQAGAFVAAGAAAADAAVPLREAHSVAARIGARPLLRELELLAERAGLDLAPPHAQISRRG
jgi:hypothetical protein